MNAQENALRVIRFDHPEWVMEAPPSYALKYLGTDHEGYAGGGHDCPLGSRWVDIWGTEWHKEHEGVMGFPRGNPLADPAALSSYEWPDPNDERICARIYELAAAFPGGDQFLSGRHRDTLWEKAYMLIGMENLMIYFFTEPEFVREVLHRIMEFQLGIAAHYLKLGIEFAHLGDDLGTQRGPLLGPQIVGQFLAPEYRRLFDLYRQRGVLIGFHSCGNIASVLDMFMDLGVNVLNPAQATANDLDQLRARTQGRMALQGGVSSATIMAGPVERIAAEVRERIWQLGQTGGYFCAPDQGMPYPAAHLEAFHQAVADHGRYPVAPPPR